MKKLSFKEILKETLRGVNMESIFNVNKPITEIIKARISTRTYKEIDVEEEKIEALNKFLEWAKGPFDEKVRFKWLNTNEDLNGAKLGTYGVIKGAKRYLGVAVTKGEFDLEELGYRMEMFVLYAEYLGLGTCWMGGTFKRSEFAKVMEVGEDEIFPIVTPVGYSADKKSLLDSAIRFVANSKHRKEWSDVFFLRDFSWPLTQFNNLGKFKSPLENTRLAPSASNKQPWRIVKVGEDFHFYIARNKGYSDKLGFDIQRIDIGIAMCHFELSCKELGLKGKFKKLDTKIKEIPDNVEYVITWVKG